MQYPYFNSQYQNQSNQCQTLVIFMIGGVTYQEAKEIELFKKEFVMPKGPSLAMSG